MRQKEICASMNSSRNLIHKSQLMFYPKIGPAKTGPCSRSSYAGPVAVTEPYTLVGWGSSHSIHTTAVLDD